ncbi:MAG: cation-translocating P-type ATPase [Candidatus Woesearchaeota archaeon]
MNEEYKSNEMYNLEQEEVIKKLKSSENGLSTKQAKKRIEEYGKNELDNDNSISALKIFISQFNDNLIYLLILAAIISISIGFLPGQDFEFTEAIIISIILLVNGIFGFIQDYRAEKSIQVLKEMSAPEATVTRDGKKIEIDAKNIVLGDIIHLEQGDEVPADARIIYADSLSMDESTLTGESASVSKHEEKINKESSLAERSNMVYMNTHVVKGRGRAIITETGMYTQVGKIADELNNVEEEETPFQREVNKMGKKIGFFVIGIVSLTAIIQLLFTGANWVTVMLSAVGLAVAATPESLPVIVTATLALGSKKMAEKNAVVRSLPVVEALGSVDHIVTDKTGTLTEGVMTVEKIYFKRDVFSVSGRGSSTEGKFFKNHESIKENKLNEILECGLFCNNSEKREDGSYRGDPTEIALLVSAKKASLKQDKKRVKSIPFSSKRKRMTTIMDDGNAYMKGAPEVILSRCNRILTNDGIIPLDEKTRNEIKKVNHNFANDALRVLGFAKKIYNKDENEDEIESNMIFLGLQGMIDPERSEVKKAVEDCRNAGIGLVMATGDNIITAKAIGKKLGFKTKGALKGEDLDKMSNEDLRDCIEEIEIFARVTPEDKVRILDALQDLNYTVAMTGDGVNDAPALKDSSVGVAMGKRGTDVAKKSSDMVLEDDNFATIVDAISEGRHIFDNIRKVTNQLLSTNSGEVMFVFLGTLIGGLFFPEFFSGSEVVVLTTAMILWVNFASDGPPAIALGEDPKVKGIMKRPPRSRDESIIDKKIIAMIAFTGPIAALTILPLFFLNINNFKLAQTMLFMGLAFFEILMFHVIRQDYGLKLKDNYWLIAGILFASLTHLSIIYIPPISELFGVVPLGLKHWFFISIPLFIFFIIEVTYRKFLTKLYGDRKVHED